ncbi:MAG TPA: extracellular solute-binding protein [Chloroflexota bacterium]|nr:extracellular solute-binding protein [Chloroflexota bacterium]HZU37549.1 extracellular solute-binding protein [Gemmataceae bacterium]
MKRFQPLLAVLITLVLLIVSVPLSSHAGTTQDATCKSTTILRASGWSGADQEAALVMKGIGQFQKLNPCIKVYYSPVPGNYQQKIQVEFASKDEPDVFYLSPDMMANEGKAGLLLKLDPYLMKDHVDLGAYIPTLLHIFQYKGATYGLPKDWGTLGVFYNKGIFDAKHVKYPTNDLTFDQFRTLAQQVYTPNANPAKVIYGTMMPADLGRFMAFMYGFGTDIFDPVTNKVLFNNAKAVQALDYYTSFQLVDHTATIPSTVGDGWQGDSFGKGKVAMVIEGGWLTPYLRTTYPKIRFGVAQFPIGPAGRADPVFTNAWAASARTADPAAAAKLIEYLTGATYQRQQLHAGFALPTIQSLQSDPFLKTHPEVANLFASYEYGKRGNFEQYDSVVNKALNDAITSVLLKKSTPAQAIPAAAKTIQSQIAAVP